MKVIHYIPSLDIASGGTTTYMQLLAQELGQLTELHVVSHQSENPALAENCKLHYVSPSLMGTFKKEWKALLNEIKPEVVHINCCWMPQCAMAQQVAQQAGYKVVLSPHGMLEPWIIRRNYWLKKVPALLLYQKKAVKKAEALHATAESEKQNLLRLGYNPQVVVIANGISLSEIKMKHDWMLKKKILFLSRIHQKKGIEFLIEAAAILEHDLAGWQIEIAGEGDAAYIGSLKQRVREKGLEEIIRFVGFVYGEEKWELFRQADVFVLPTFSENFGLAVAESLAAGTPVITTHGTPWEDLQTARCGWWVPVGTEALVGALRSAVNSGSGQLEEMGRNGRKLVEDKFSNEQMAKKMLQLYESL